MSSSDVQKADANLWLAYGIQLKDTLAQSSGAGPDDRFYIAPLSAAGIAAGKSIDVAIKNNGIYNIGDTLLSLDQPVFLPSRQSYFQRCLDYCGSVALHKNGDTGAEVRYKTAQEAQTKAAANFQATKAAAFKAYNEDKTMGMTNDSFPVWVTQNYPQLSQAQNANDGATAAAASAAAAMDGPMASLVGKYQSALSSANGLVSIPGMNMSCSSASADQVSAGHTGTENASSLKPLYQIDAQYAQNVDSWINTFDQKKDNPTRVTFNLSQAESSSWKDMGFSDTNVSVTGSYCIFFSATFTENNKVVTKNVSAADCGADLEVTITFTSHGSYKIAPGSWNPGQVFGAPIMSNSNPNLSKPMAYINTVVLAYGVGMEVKLSTSASTTVNNYLEKARSTGGSASIFGYNIGLGGSAESTQTSTTTFDQVKSASSGTTISIPPADNAYPTLLAAFGQAIPLPETK